MTDDVIEMTSMEKIHMVDKQLRALASAGEELLQGIKSAQVHVEQVNYLNALKLRCSYLSQKKEKEKMQSLLNSLKENKLTEFQRGKVKLLRNNLSDVHLVQEQISFLLDSLEEVTLEKEADKEIIKLAKSTIEKWVAEQRESAEPVFWEDNKTITATETKADNRMLCLHCPKCKQPMACVIYIDGDSIQDMEHVAEKMAEYINDFAKETWIVASPLEVSQVQGQKVILSYIMRVWPQKSKPEKILSNAFNERVIDSIAERHCDSDS